MRSSHIESGHLKQARQTAMMLTCYVAICARRYSLISTYLLYRIYFTLSTYFFNFNFFFINLQNATVRFLRTVASKVSNQSKYPNL